MDHPYVAVLEEAGLVGFAFFCDNDQIIALVKPVFTSGSVPSLALVLSILMVDFGGAIFLCGRDWVIGMAFDSFDRRRPSSKGRNVDSSGGEQS